MATTGQIGLMGGCSLGPARGFTDLTDFMAMSTTTTILDTGTTDRIRHEGSSLTTISTQTKRVTEMAMWAMPAMMGRPNMSPAHHQAEATPEVEATPEAEATQKAVITRGAGRGLVQMVAPSSLVLGRSGCHGIVEPSDKRLITPVALGEAQRLDALHTYLGGVGRIL